MDEVLESAERLSIVSGVQNEDGIRASCDGPSCLAEDSSVEMGDSIPSDVSGLEDETSDSLVLPYAPVPVIDMDRFLGKWYEIAKIPNRWQANGSLATVSYIRNPKNGKLRIVSRLVCDNKTIEQSGRLWVLDKEKNSSYKCQFVWPFTGLFWILHVGEKEDYGHTVIGDPIKCNLWILSRTPFMEDYVYEKLVAQLEWQGYNVSKLVRTPQSEDLSLYPEDPNE